MDTKFFVPNSKSCSIFLDHTTASLKKSLIERGNPINMTTQTLMKSSRTVPVTCTVQTSSEMQKESWSFREVLKITGKFRDITGNGIVSRN
jgi:hypothetical protein